MIDMNATILVNGLEHPVDNNANASEIQNKKIENYDSVGEQEEGQIIDDVDFEDISSDEDPIVFTEADEASMRKRIEELELRNAELEKIAVISVINNYDLGNKIVPHPENQVVDVIDLSDYDDYPKYIPNKTAPSAFVPYESKYNTLKNYYTKFPNSTSPFSTNVTKTYHKSRKRRRRAHSSENKNYDENKSSKTSRIKKRRKKSHSPPRDCSNSRQKPSSTKRHQNHSKRSKRKRRVKNQHVAASSDDSDTEKNENFELNREELRKAVKRNSETGRRGNIQNIVGKKSQILLDLDANDDVVEVENNNEVERINSEAKDETEINNENILVATEDSDSLEEQTLRFIALKSAIVKKHLDRKKRKEIDEKKPYSPSDFDYWCNGLGMANSPKNFDDLDLIDSNNISPSESPLNLSDDGTNTKSVNIDLVNTDTDSDVPIFIDTPKLWQPNLPSIDILKQLAPPPPQISILSQMPKRFDNKNSKDIVDEDNSKLIISQKNSSPDDLSDEEELALRELLLSTMNSPKVNLITRKTVLTDNSQNTILNKNIDLNMKDAKIEKVEDLKSPIITENKEDSSHEDDINELKNNLLKIQNTNKTESLLKEAVKRLKTTTLNDLSDNDQNVNGQNYLSENETDKSSKYIVPDCKDSFKDTQIITSDQETLVGLISEINMDLIDSGKAGELLNKSRQKLSKFIQSSNKEKFSGSEIEELEDVQKIVEDEKFETTVQSASCIEALQKIIRLNYKKLINEDVEEFYTETENFKNNNSNRNMELEVNIENCESNSSSKHLVVGGDIENCESDNSDKNMMKVNIDVEKCESNNSQKYMEIEMDTENSESNISNTISNIPIILSDPQNNYINTIDSTQNSVENINFLNKQTSDQAAVQQLPDKMILNILPVESCIENKIDNSWEITKRIELLQKLSESIAQTTKITAKAKASLDVSKSQSINSNSKITNNIVQSRKIVKINKIINQTTSTRNHVSNQSIPSNKLIKLSSMSSSSRVSPTNILDGASNSMRVSKINRTTGKIIISVGVNSSSDDDDYNDNMLESVNDSFNKNEEIQYDDNASPMSFQLDSPICYSPNINTQNIDDSYTEESGNITEIEKSYKKISEKNTLLENSSSENTIKSDKNVPLSRNVINDVFQAKLDKFLKNARTQVEIEKSEEKKIPNEEIEPKTPVSKLSQSINSSVVTPAAVRHLPESSQLEYRMLINRIKILERQKLAKTQQIESNDICNSICTEQKISENVDNITDSVVEDKKETQKSISVLSENNISLNHDQNIETPIINETTIKNVTEVVENIISNNANKIETECNTDEDKTNKQEISINSTAKEHKIKQSLELLKKYEAAYDKNSHLILENLNRALKFVEMGREVKIKKVLLETKIEKLRNELRTSEADLKLQNQKISKIYPAISKSYDTIVNLKGRRLKLNKVSKHLGKTLNGNSYRLKEGNHTKIQSKFKHLSNEMNFLKNLKISDIQKFTNELQNKSVILINSTTSCNTETKINSKEIQKKFKGENEKDIENVEQENDDKNESLINNNKKRVTELKSQKLEDAELDQVEPIVKESSVNVLDKEFSNNDTGTCNYISPLDFLNERPILNGNSMINPLEVICPFQLMGQCDDKDCKYNHFNLGCLS